MFITDQIADLCELFRDYKFNAWRLSFIPDNESQYLDVDAMYFATMTH